MGLCLARVKSRRNSKTYETVLLRESSREGTKVKTRTLCNLTGCAEGDIALKFKRDPAALERALTAKGAAPVAVEQGLEVGATAALEQVARRLGLEAAPGPGPEAALALWQVPARLIDPGSRLSAVRLAQTHAACDVPGLDGFNEDERELRRSRASSDMTVREGIARPATLCGVVVKAPGLDVSLHQIPTPREDVAKVLDAAGVKLSPPRLAGGQP